MDYKLFCDSTCDLTDEIAKEQGIELEKPKETSTISFNNN